MNTVKICLGSACFARGNAQTLAFLEEYIAQHPQKLSLELVGCRCSGLCKDGPNIFINDKKYSHLSQTELTKILEQL